MAAKISGLPGQVIVMNNSLEKKKGCRETKEFHVDESNFNSRSLRKLSFHISVYIGVH